MIVSVIASGRISAKRVWKRLGIAPDECIAFGVVPIACATLGPTVIRWTWPSVVFALLLICACTAGVVARRRGYSLPRTAWFAFVGILALFGWGVFLDWVGAILAGA